MTHHNASHTTTGATGGDLLGHHQTGHHNSHLKTTDKHTTTHHPNGAVTHSTTTGIPKVPMGQKISGKMDVLVGEMTHNPAKVAIGHAKQDGGVMKPQAH